MTEDAVFEALALDCRVDEYGTVRYFNTLGKLHRVYGPAVEWPDGTYEWWLNDRKLTEAEWQKHKSKTIENNTLVAQR